MEYSNGTELTHYGVKGMKWGIRRTQEQLDRAAGRVSKVASKAASKVKSAASSAYQSHKAKKSSQKQTKQVQNSKKKSIYEMSNEELKTLTERYRLEANYWQARADVARYQPKKVSKGKELIGKVLNDAVLPTVKQLAKDKMTEVGKNVLGLNKPEDPYEKLKTQADRLNTINRILKMEESINKIIEDRKKAEENEPKAAKSVTVDIDDGVSYEVPNNSYTRTQQVSYPSLPSGQTTKKRKKK